MCKKMKAVHYLKNFEAAECLDLYANSVLFPEIDETAMWCNDQRYDILLDLGLGRMMVASLALVALLGLL